METAASPYTVPLKTDAERTDVRAAAPGDRKNDVSPSELADFVKKVSGSTEAEPGASREVRTIDESTGEIVKTDLEKQEAFTEATLQKVAAFLDPTTQGPLTMLVARHKAFAMRIPTQQELLDVSAIMGRKAGEEMTETQAQWSIIGELKKACRGWVPEASPAAQLLRANIAWPDKWPPLNQPAWTETRDPFVMGDEILPLWRAYLAWREKVVPTREEIDFYYANQG